MGLAAGEAIVHGLRAFSMETWRSELVHIARSSQAKCDSVELITNAAHAKVAAALLRAFRNDPACRIYAEPRTPDRVSSENAKPTDILILHPAIGCFLVEVKGWMIDEITAVEAGTIFRRRNGLIEAHNPWHQAQNASLQIQKATERVVERRGLTRGAIPYFDWIVAFPNIPTATWKRYYEHSLHGCELLLAEDIAEPKKLHDRLISYIRAKAGYRLPFSTEQLDHVREALGSSAIINKRKRKTLTGNGTGIGPLIDDLELKDKRLSTEQMELIEADFDGRPQLIRGVAGSGKSIVLVKNCANAVDRAEGYGQMSLDGNQPQKRFAIVCFNHALVPFLQQRFDESFRELTFRDVQCSVDITYMNGLLYKLSTHCGGPLLYQRYEDYLKLYGEQAPLHIAVHYASQLDYLEKSQPELFDKLLYDTIYVDEGQDLFEEEYLLLMRLLRPAPKTGLKNIIIFYDDAQNLYGRPRPVWSKLGIQVTGRSEVMKTCFRNTRQIVEFALNLLLGTKAETRVQTRTFADLSYLKANNLVVELTDRWQVNFAARTDGEIPEVRLFDTREQEKQWILSYIRKLIEKEHVHPEDILVIFHDPAEFANLISATKRNIPSIHKIITPYGRNNPEKDHYIFEEHALTFSTVKSAKGYDCPIVFLAGADLFVADTEGRAAFYVAATRAKLRLYVTGLRGSGNLAEEAQTVAGMLRQPMALESIASELSAKKTGSSLYKEEIRIYRKGEAVMHPVYGMGHVLEDGHMKFLPTLNRHVQMVKAQLDGRVADFAVELSGLKLMNPFSKEQQ
jgi:superfamily I DNA and RNA helicase